MNCWRPLIKLFYLVFVGMPENNILWNPANTSAVIAALGKRGTSLFLSGDAGYAAAKAIFNIVPKNEPEFVYECHSVSDVVIAVQTAVHFGLHIAVKSGGCSMEGFSTCSGPCIQVSLSKMKDITVDKESLYANISAGAMNVDVYERLFPEELTLASGTCKGVGYAGQALGGGLGLLMRNHGVASDSILAMQVVLADGRVVMADGTGPHKDLYWALRGGGNGNFGIVTSFKVRLYSTAGNLFQVRKYRVSKPRAAEAFVRWQRWVHGDAALGVPPLAREAFSRWSKEGSGADIVRVVYNGTEAATTAAMATLLEGGGLTRVATTTQPCGTMDDQGFNGNNLTWEQAIGCFWHCGQGHFSNLSYPGAYSRIAQSVGSMGQAQAWMSAYETINLPEHSACATAIKRFDEGGWADVLVDSMGGAVNEVPANDERSGAFPHRKAVYSMQFNVFWPADSTGQVIKECKSWLKSVYAAAGSAGISDNAYRNYPSKTLPSTGKAGYRRLYYGNNLERLLEVKAKYDPQSIFSYAQGLSQHHIMPH